jgi:hypothetical protein
MTFATVLMGIFSVFAFILSIYTYYRSKKEQSYADIDSLYFEILKLGMEYPKFRNLEYTFNYKNEIKDEGELYRYEIYAFIVWNLCETIYDRKSKALDETWYPIIETENKLHRKWFDNHENYHKFKDRFREYIQNNFPQEYKNRR